MVFSDTSLNQGILQQTRAMMRVDATQWPTAKVVASVNNWLDFVEGHLVGSDKRFQFDDTNHTKLPEGTTNLVANQSDYSFLTDEQGNTILNLTRIEMLSATSNGTYSLLTPIDMTEFDPDSINAMQTTAGLPLYYDKIADNIVRLYPKPSTSVTAGLKFYFQRAPSYFTAADTTKAPGVAPLLHRGFVIAAAYDGALTLGLANLQGLAVEREREERRVIEHYARIRNNDERHSLTMAPVRSFR